MAVFFPKDRSLIEGFLRRDPWLHLYELGDLDPFYWPHTIWIAEGKAGSIDRLALLYAASELPVLLAFSREPDETQRAFLRRILPCLPARFYAHLTVDPADAFGGAARVESHGAFLRMGLLQPRLDGFDDPRVVMLGTADRAAIQGLYEASYPGNWFDPRMLETGFYFAVREGDGLLAAAGVHVVSPVMGVAAIGNVATLPAARGRSLATIVCARLCRRLLEVADHVGLNVSLDNAAALACYRRLGFEPVATFREMMVTRA